MNNEVSNERTKSFQIVHTHILGVFVIDRHLGLKTIFRGNG
jgi:hypothetical protein